MPCILHPEFKYPENKSATIWRYMDFIKFISMLESESLFFTRADKFEEDKFEGMYSNLNLKNVREDCKSSTELLPKELINNQRNLTYWTFINCWHMNEHESAAMWKIYGKIDESIAIKSSFNSLVNELPKETLISMVEYIDYTKEKIPEKNVLSPFLYKRKSFEHEKEIRAITFDNLYNIEKKSGEKGVPCKVKLKNLIDAIYVSPTSESWFKDLVEKLTIKYKINAPVIKSSLDDDPIL